MLRSLVALLILSLISLPVPAAGEHAAAASPEMIRNNAALSMITFPWKALHYEIVFLPAKEGYRAMTYPKQKRIEIYVRATDDPKRMAHTIAHELGHAIDMTYNTPETRRKWMEYRGIEPSTTWFSCNRCSDFTAPSGDFAETFALLQVGPDFFAARIAPRPSAKDIPTLISFFTFLPENAFPAPSTNNLSAGLK
jgi:hypothetical protein